MKKQILPAVIGALLAGTMTTATADIIVFGHLDTSVDATDQDGGTDDINFNCNTCSLGFKGSEDLGNGLKAIFKIDFQFDMFERNPTRANGVPQNTFGTTAGSSVYSTTTKASVVHTSAITDRDQWLGLAGNFGQVRFGTISTSYKSHGAMLDPFYRTALQGRDRGLQSNLHSGAGEEGQGRATNTVRYDTPNWNGLQGTVHYTLDSDEYPKEDENPYGFGASYTNGGLLVFADYITNDRGGSDDAWKVGGKYTMGMFALMGQYEADGGLISSKGITVGPTSSSRENKIDGRDLWYVAGSATLGNTLLYGAYARGDDSDGTTKTGRYNAWTIAASHNLSKRTQLYAGHSQVDCNTAGGSACRMKGENDKFSLGMKHKF